MSRVRRAAALCSALLAAAPAYGDVFVSPEVITEPTPSAFSVCYDRSCTRVDRLALEPEQWEAVRVHFDPPPADAAAERAAAAAAVAEMERIVGPLTGTDGDLAENDGTTSAYAMDCIDESTNTTSYLRIFEAAGLLRFHSVGDRVTRGWFVLGWPHTTAVLQERGGGGDWAVDSWFHANGELPELVPIEVWRAHWHPPPQHEQRAQGR